MAARTDLYLFPETSQNCNGDLVICDQTGFSNNGFIREDDLESVGRYKLSEVVIFTVLLYNSSNTSEVIETNFKHFTSEEIINYDHNYSKMFPQQELKLNLDGYYTIYYLAIPKEISLIRQYNFKSDLEGNLFNEYGEEVKFEDLKFCNSNIMYYIEDIFSVHNLRKEYIKYVYDGIFKTRSGIINRIKSSCCQDNSSKQVHQDVIGSALSAIKYLLEDCKYQEAQIVIEELSHCNDIYNNQNTSFNNIIRNNCGCS